MITTAGSATALVADRIASLGQEVTTIPVSLSNELVQLLSDQLYQSPLKAIEELVVNAYDADATECRVFVPEPGDLERRFVAVFDNGVGMDVDGLADLWQIGRSKKRLAEIEQRARRKQIGKFGIGKLATYAIANRVTYASRKDGPVYSVTLDFRSFKPSPYGTNEAVTLIVHKTDQVDAILKDPQFASVFNALGADIQAVSDSESWTVVVLEDFKPKASRLSIRRLRWVLSTAMPLVTDFTLYLNQERVESSKSTLEPVVEFSVADLPKARLEALSERTGEKWEVRGNALISPSFPSGVSGTVIVTRETLNVGKSEDIGRSNGFFVRVRRRLINEDDPLFGLGIKSHQTYNRMRAEIEADDLDEVITATREGVEDSELRGRFQSLLNELFNEARERYDEIIQAEEQKEQRKKDGERNYVNPWLVEYPVADTLTVYGSHSEQPDADNQWFYLDIPPGADFTSVARSLYDTRDRAAQYKYRYVNKGRSARMVRFNPLESSFYINLDHELVEAYRDDARASVLLEDVATAEALLEVYLREHDIPPHTVGEILERRDLLLRSLARDHVFSLEALARDIRESGSNEHELEVALISAARGLGFVAKHISGSGEPDGIARFVDYPSGEKTIILEAKSSEKVPSLAAIDFAGLEEHMERYNADGCLLVAPAYPGSTRGKDSAAARRARKARVSCWTTQQLARVVQEAERRHLTARHVLDIVLNAFAPQDVEKAVDALFKGIDNQKLYIAIIESLKELSTILTDAPRSVELIAPVVVRRLGNAPDLTMEEIVRAVSEMAAASQGVLTLRGDKIVLHGSYEELERRLDGLTGVVGEPRREGRFRGPFPAKTSEERPTKE